MTEHVVAGKDLGQRVGILFVGGTVIEVEFNDVALESADKSVGSEQFAHQVDEFNGDGRAGRVVVKVG